MPRIMYEWSREELEALQTMIVVENYERSKSGKGRRSYLETFDANERRVIGLLYHKFYQWHLVKGIPEKQNFSVKVVDLIKRAVCFFATV